MIATIFRAGVHLAIAALFVGVAPLALLAVAFGLLTLGDIGRTTRLR